MDEQGGTRLWCHEVAKWRQVNNKKKMWLQKHGKNNHALQIKDIYLVFFFKKCFDEEGCFCFEIWTHTMYIFIPIKIWHEV